jgi:multidrug resistance efflux pump
MKRTFEITLPTFRWGRFLVFVIVLGVGLVSFYWWKNIHPFFKIERAVLYIPEIEVRSFGSGRLSNCFFDEGDFFRQGQSLFALDQSAFVAKLKETDRKIGVHRQQVEQAKQRVDQGMEQYAYLQSELSLEGKTSGLLDQILAEAQQMQSDCFQMEKELVAFQNERSELEKLIGRGSFVADFEGVVLRRLKQAGDSVLEGEPIFLISNHQKRWVEAEIPEKMLLKIRVGSLATIELPSFPKEKWQAQVSWISPVAKEGKLKIRMTAENLPRYSGLTAKALIHATAN